MSDVLTLLYNNCDPLQPAPAQFYVDCSDVRGSNALTRQFQDNLVKAEGFLRVLFTGHIGGGKSSELVHLEQVLRDPKPSSPHKRYFPILMDAGEYLDEYDVTPSDILLAIVTEVAAAFKERMGIELRGNYFVRRLNEIKEFFLTEQEIKEWELTLGAVKAKVQRLQRDPDARVQVREKLLPQMTSFLSEINHVFEEARLALKKYKYPADSQPYTDIVLILDNLEKIQRLAGHPDGEASQIALFIERAPQLTGLNAHVVYTVPLTLARSQGPKLISTYGAPLIVLPMIKVEERGTHTPYEPGRQCLRDILQKRAGKTPLDEVFTQEALDWLITYCGGDIRTLMHFVQRATTQIEKPPLDLKAVQRGMKQTVANIGASVRTAYWPKLAQLERMADQQMDNNDADYRAMLEQLYVMEYMNGGEPDDFFQGAAYWYAVHPILRQLSQFKAALAALDRETAASAKTENGS